MDREFDWEIERRLEVSQEQERREQITRTESIGPRARPRTFSRDISYPRVRRAARRRW